MKRDHALWGVTALLLFFLSVPDAKAICQTCKNNYSANATCWTVGEYDYADFGACTEETIIVDGEEVEYCEGWGSSPGSECNKSNDGGGGEGGGDGGGHGDDQTDECSGGEYGCPAQCSSCG